MRTLSSRLRGGLSLLLLAGWSGGAVLAQEPGAPNTQGRDLLTSPTEPKPANKGMFERDQLAGDFGGLRTRLADKGVTFGAIYTGEVFGNPKGGVRKGAVYDGLLEVDLDIDFEKLAGLPGLTFHGGAFDIHGPSGTDKYVGDAGVFSNIDFYDSVRLFELWAQQEVKIPHLGKLNLRVGQLASDKEFYGSEVSALFINSDFGALPILSANVPEPIFAITCLGVRLRWEPTPAFYLQAAVYDGNPDPDTLGDPSPGFTPGTRYNHNGIAYNLNSKEGAFSIYEAGYRLNQGKDAKGLPGTYKVGGFYHTDTFSDLRDDNRGRRLADPLSTGIARGLDGEYGAYLTVDQTLYRPAAPPELKPKDGKDAKDHNAPAAKTAGGDAEAPAGDSDAPSGVLTDKGLYGFLRVGGAPSDRSTLSFYLDGGFSYRGLLPTREKDLLGVAVAYARFSDQARRADRDNNFFFNESVPPRDEEIVVEVSYQAVLTPWWSVQPDAQCIIHPGGSTAIDDALVLGVRTVLLF